MSRSASGITEGFDSACGRKSDNLSRDKASARVLFTHFICVANKILLPQMLSTSSGASRPHSNSNPD